MYGILKILLDYQYKKGSYNFTSTADNRNSENLLIVYNKDIAKKYLDNWDVRKKSSRIFKY
jgi:phospholipase D